MIESVTNGRTAFDTFCCADPRKVEAGIRLKQAKYLVPVTTAGDVFEAPAFTTFGTPYDSAIRLFKSIAHNGDSVPAAAGRDVPRFRHEASSWATLTTLCSPYTWLR